jgi:cytochrome c
MDRDLKGSRLRMMGADSMPLRESLAATILSLALASVAASAARAEPAREDLNQREQGANLVNRNCGACHATGRSDSSPLAQAPAFRDLHQRYSIEALGEALAEGMLTGHPSMPEFRFAPSEVAAIITYLQSIQSRQSTRYGD